MHHVAQDCKNARCHLHVDSKLTSLVRPNRC